jgi:predicted ribosome quality control (RQC) complex YloA/Tae2 family protein
MGDLILARFRGVPRGVAHVTLPGFDGAPVKIELDPTLSPQDNAARRYAEAARLERARSSLPERIRAADAERSEWETVLRRVCSGEVPWGALESALGPERTTLRPGGPGPAPALPYRRLTSSTGLEIRVGRGARENDELTFHHSAPDDIWLHAHQAAGAHVILRWGRKENPPRPDLIEAATLAALHSRARGSASVSVVWTRRKDVRKPRRAPPGKVAVERSETLLVEPNPELVARLEK